MVCTDNTGELWISGHIAYFLQLGVNPTVSHYITMSNRIVCFTTADVKINFVMLALWNSDISLYMSSLRPIIKH